MPDIPGRNTNPDCPSNSAERPSLEDSQWSPATSSATQEGGIFSMSMSIDDSGEMHQIALRTTNVGGTADVGVQHPTTTQRSARPLTRPPAPGEANPLSTVNLGKQPSRLSRYFGNYVSHTAGVVLKLRHPQHRAQDGVEGSSSPATSASTPLNAILPTPVAGSATAPPVICVTQSASGIVLGSSPLQGDNAGAVADDSFLDFVSNLPSDAWSAEQYARVAAHLRESRRKRLIPTPTYASVAVQASEFDPVFGPTGVVAVGDGNESNGEFEPTEAPDEDAASLSSHSSSGTMAQIIDWYTKRDDRSRSPDADTGGPSGRGVVHA